MLAYECVAPYYDILMEDVNYEGWADYLERHFKRHNKPIKTVLDLACGTGTIASILNKRGYDVTGVDSSPDMLSQAVAKVPDVLFLNQKMEKLDLNDTVDAAICCIDGFNYILSEKALNKAFERIHIFLNPGGLLVFDVLTPYHFRHLDGKAFISECGGVLCTWQPNYSNGLVHYDITLFIENPDNTWRRYNEQQTEREYSIFFLTEMLRRNGFDSILIFGNKRMIPPLKRSRRVFISAICKK